MEIIVHKHFTLDSAGDVHHQYQTPVWEVEVKSDVLDVPEFDLELRNDQNFAISEVHRTNLRSIYNGTGVVSKLLAEESHQDFFARSSESDSWIPAQIL